MWKSGRRVAAMVAAVMVITTPTWAAPAREARISLVLTGQAMLQSDFRVDSPRAAAAIRPLLRGDVVFTNFESTVERSGQSLAGSPGGCTLRRGRSTR